MASSASSKAASSQSSHTESGEQQKVSKWGQRKRYLPSARFSTERLDLILAKLKGPDDSMPGSKHKSQQDLSVDKVDKDSERGGGDRGNSKSWNVYMHDSPFAKNRSIFEDLIAEKSEKPEDNTKGARTKPKRLPTYEELAKTLPQDTENANYDIKDTVNVNETRLKKFEHDIDTVPTRDTELPMDTVNTVNTANDAKSDTASITSSGNDVVSSRDGHHNDSGYHDDANSDYHVSQKGISFSIDTGRRTWSKMDDNAKSATLPTRGSCRGREGFVNQAKSWWQSKQEKSMEKFQPPPLSPPPKDTNNNSNRLYQKRQSASTLHKQKQGLSTTPRSSTPQFKDRFSSAKVKSEEEKKAERKHKDNSNAPPLSMQSTEAFRIWKLREELDNRTRDAEAYADEVEKQMPPGPKSRPTTPTAGRNRPRTPSSIRPTTPIDLRPTSPAVVSRSHSEGRRLPSIPAARALSPTPTPSDNSYRTRPTTPSNERSRNRPTTPSNDRSRQRPTTPNLDRLMQPTKASKARSTTPSREYIPLHERNNALRSVTPTASMYSSTQSLEPSRRPTTPSKDYSPSPDRTRKTNQRPTTPSKDYDYSPSLDRSRKLNQRPTTPSKDYDNFPSPDSPRKSKSNPPPTTQPTRALSPSPQRGRTSSTEKTGRYEQNDARSNILAPVSNRARARRIQPVTPDEAGSGSHKSRSRSRTPSRDRKDPGIRERAVSPGLLERAVSPSPVGISIRERQLLQANILAASDHPGAPQPSQPPRSKSADILGDKSDWPVAPPRRTRKRPGRMLPSTPQAPQSEENRPKSPFCNRPVTPCRDTEIPGEGEAIDEPMTNRSMNIPKTTTSMDIQKINTSMDMLNKNISMDMPKSSNSLDVTKMNSSMDISMESNVFSSPEQENPPALKSPQSQASISLTNTMKDDKTTSSLNGTSSTQNSPDKQTITMSKPKTNDITNRNQNDSLAQRKNAPAINLPSTPAKTELPSPSDYKRSPSDSKLRAQTPTRSILKKTPRAHSSDELLLEDGFKNKDFNATSSPNENYELYTQSLPRDATKRSAWNRSTPASIRSNLRRPPSTLDKRASPSFENLGKALQESLYSPLKNFGLTDTSPDKEDSSAYKRDTPRNKRDTRRNTIEGLPNTMTVATSTLTLPHRRPKSKDTVKWTPNSFKSNNLNQRLSKSSQDLRGSIFGSREDLTSPGKLTKSPSVETLQQRSKSPRPFLGTSVSNRFRRFESMDALEILETGTVEGQKVDLEENGPDFVQCEFFV